MAKRVFPLSRVYTLLEPGPVVLLTSAGARRANVMPMSWHMMVDFEPPLVACIVSDGDFSFRALRRTKECVLNIPTAELVRRVVACGNVSGRDVDKFEAFGLTPRPASRVAAPLIDECFASLECRVVDTRFVPRYGLFILEVVRAWRDPSVTRPRTLHHRGYGTFMVAGREITVPSRMP